jgi:hypothetical protein
MGTKAANRKKFRYVAVFDGCSDKSALADGNGYIENDSFVKACVTLLGVLAQQQAERDFSRAAGRRHGFEKNLGVLDRAGSAGAIDLPSPRLRRRRPVLYDDGKVRMIDHRQTLYHKNTAK